MTSKSGWPSCVDRLDRRDGRICGEAHCEVVLGDATADGDAESEVASRRCRGSSPRRRRTTPRDDAAQRRTGVNSSASVARSAGVSPSAGRLRLEAHVVEQAAAGGTRPTSRALPSSAAAVPPVFVRSHTAQPLLDGSLDVPISVVHRDPHRQVLVDERVEPDDELTLGVDGEHQRDVDARDDRER